MSFLSVPKHVKFILASTSPRRIELLKNQGIDFEIIAPEIDETPTPGETPRAMVKRLSRLKALEACAAITKATYSEIYWILSADTTVVSPTGKIIGKPQSRSEALKILTALSGKTHSVYTGYTIIIFSKKLARKNVAKNHALKGTRGVGSICKLISRVVRTDVHFRALSRKLIQSYCQSSEPMDKAGAYAAQGIGMGFIESIRGSYTNVVGLPIAQLALDLEHMSRTMK